MITPELAEIIGIYSGDGYLRFIGSRKELDISGNYEEKDYYDTHVIPLFSKFFNVPVKGQFFHSRRTYGFVIRERKVLEIFKELGFISGNKSLSIRILDEIKYSKDITIITSFLRGYFDTDGCLTFRNRRGDKNYNEFKRKYHYHPRIELTSVSKNLIIDVELLLKRLGFRNYMCVKIPKNKKWNINYTLTMMGEENLLKWMKLIGTKNTSRMSRYLIWQKYGFLPPYTTFEQRINILDGKKDSSELYSGPVV